MTAGSIEFKKGASPKFFEQGEVLHFRYEGITLVCVCWPETKKSGVAWISSNDDANSLAERLRQAVGGNYAGSLVKLLGSASELDRVEAAIAKAGGRVAARIESENKREGYFYTETGRLRLSSESNTPILRELPKREPLKREPARRERAQVIELREEKRPVRVLIVDDSKTMRQILRGIFSKSPQIEVVGEAEKPSQVEALLDKLQPDVMTLDINMPEMTGVELLRRLFPKRYLPTVMISSISLSEGHEVLTALELGAVDYIQKPSAADIAVLAPVIQEKIIGAARTKRKVGGAKAARKVIARGPIDTGKLIAIGASTGGTEAIKNIFIHLPEEIPPIVIVQHIPPHFSTAFANRLNDLCPFEVKEASDGDEVRPGRALIAPGGFHLEVVRKGNKLYARILDTEPVNRFKPSVDVLFRSVASVIGANAVGILLTGMGDDGARGLLAMRQGGAHTIAQDEETCVVYGMPRAAVEMGAAVEVKPLDAIPDLAMKLVA